MFKFIEVIIIVKVKHIQWIFMNLTINLNVYFTRMFNQLFMVILFPDYSIFKVFFLCQQIYIMHMMECVSWHVFELVISNINKRMLFQRVNHKESVLIYFLMKNYVLNTFNNFQSLIIYHYLIIKP